MNASSALEELVKLSGQVERAVVVDANGAVLGSTEDDAAEAQRLADAAGRALAVGGELHASTEAVRVEIELAEGGLFALREGGRTIAATTAPGATAGLVVYDLRTCLERIDAPKPRRRRVKVQEPPEEGDEA